MPKPNPVIKDKASWDAAQSYVSAVGKVALAWNNLHENLGDIFTVVMRARTPAMARAVWYAVANDRLQRSLLIAAINAAEASVWEKLPARARGDLLDLLKKISGLGDLRD